MTIPAPKLVARILDLFTNTTICCFKSNIPQAIRPKVFMSSKLSASSEMPHDLQSPPKSRYVDVYFIYAKSANGTKEKSIIFAIEKMVEKLKEGRKTI